MVLLNDYQSFKELLKRLNGCMDNNINEGLPRDVFEFISCHTPLVNVDLLIKNCSGHTLLTWRDDEYYGPGWHIPGGIIRHKETFEHRIQQVSILELGCNVIYDENSFSVNQLFAKDRDLRGHFISFLFTCYIVGDLNQNLKYLKGSNPKAGQWCWHKECPDNLITQHDIYRKYF